MNPYVILKHLHSPSAINTSRNGVYMTRQYNTNCPECNLSSLLENQSVGTSPCSKDITLQQPEGESKLRKTCNTQFIWPISTSCFRNASWNFVPGQASNIIEAAHSCTVLAMWPKSRFLTCQLWPVPEVSGQNIHESCNQRQYPIHVESGWRFHILILAKIDIKSSINYTT